jgi:hypothetical protein
MTNTDWIDLLRLIPEDQHNKLVVTTLTGVDLNIEVILRTEETFVAFRGRISGITDEGRVFFVPYRQIDYLQINRQVKEAEIHEMFGGMAPAGDAGRAPSGVFAAPTAGSKQGAVAPTSPSKQSFAGIAARLSGITSPNRESVIAPPPPAGEGPTPPRNSILERLRAQRNSVVTTKPSGR